MNAIVGSNTVKTTIAAQAQVTKPKVEDPKVKITAPVKAAEVINKVPANKINTTPAAVVSLGKTKAPEPALYNPQVTKKAVPWDQPTAGAKSEKPTAAKVESAEASGSFVAGEGDVVVDIKNSDPGYGN